MQNTLLLCTVELLLFKLAAAAPDSLQDKYRVHERLEYNRHILHDDADDGQVDGVTLSTSYLSSATDSLPSLPTVFARGACGQPQARDIVTTIYYDDGDMLDEDTETDDITIYQTFTATETDIYDCGCAAPTPDPLPVITSYLPDPQPIVQTICPVPPPSISISICTVAVPTTVVVDNCTPSTFSTSACTLSSTTTTPAPCAASSSSSSDSSSSSATITTADDSEPTDDSEPAPAPCGCHAEDIEYDHPFGDDTLDWVLDTKDHTRHRWENFKDRADRAVSHVRPGHIHDRISQVLHDGRPQRSDEHRELHDYHGRTPVQDRRARARYDRRVRNSARSRSRYPYTYERDYYPDAPLRRVREPSRGPPARRVREPVRQAAREPVRDPVRRRPYDRVPIRDTCRAPTSGCDYEHQYGDDTMNYMLDTKDHTRHLYNRVKDRTKKAASHFKPSHVHDRADQFVHEERPERTEDHLDLHEHRGYY